MLLHQPPLRRWALSHSRKGLVRSCRKAPCYRTQLVPRNILSFGKTFRAPVTSNVKTFETHEASRIYMQRDTFVTLVMSIQGHQMRTTGNPILGPDIRAMPSKKRTKLLTVRCSRVPALLKSDSAPSESRFCQMFAVRDRYLSRRISSRSLSGVVFPLGWPFAERHWQRGDVCELIECLGASARRLESHERYPSTNAVLYINHCSSALFLHARPSAEYGCFLCNISPLAPVCLAVASSKLASDQNKRRKDPKQW